MSEYNNSYNWERTWLNSSPSQRANSERRSAEPHIQHKRHFKNRDSSQFWYQNVQGREEDPFFVIHEKKQSELAYPNILYKRSKSAPRERTVTAPTKVLAQQPPRPKSDANTVEKQINHHSKKHHSKSRSKEKRPIERWPELRVDIPDQSSQSKASRMAEYQRTNLNDRYKKQPKNSKIDSKSKVSPIEVSNKQQNVESRLHERLKRSVSNVSSENAPGEQIEAKDDTPSDTRQSRIKSEYQANYRNFSEYSKNIARIHNEEAKLNQRQVEGCHFDRKHFNQLASGNVNLWDPPTSSRSDIVGVDPTLLRKHSKEFKIPIVNRRSRLENDFRTTKPSDFPQFRDNLTTSSTKYEPSKYVQKRWREDEEPRIKVLPLECSDNVYACTPTSHQCNKGGNFLVSRTRSEPQWSQVPSNRHFTVSTSPAYVSPFPSSSGLSLAEHTFERALRRRNRLLISACRN